MPGAPRRVIRRRKLHEEVAAHLEQLIATGHWVEGEQLPSERELMERFGVGRPAVREALLSLEKMGLLALSSGERARVTRPTAETLVGQLSGAARHLLARPEGMRDFQDARRLFESALAWRAADCAAPEDLHALKAALDANRNAIGDRHRFERTDLDFHVTLAGISRNPLFLALHDAIVSWLALQRTVTLRNPGAERKAYDSHHRIYEAVAAHDPAAAWRAMDDHLREVARLYWQALDGAEEKMPESIRENRE